MPSVISAVNSHETQLYNVYILLPIENFCFAKLGYKIIYKLYICPKMLVLYYYFYNYGKAQRRFQGRTLHLAS